MLMMLILIALPAMAQTREEAAALWAITDGRVPEVAGLSPEKTQQLADATKEAQRGLEKFITETNAAICAKRDHYENAPEDLASALQAASAEFDARRVAHAKALLARLNSLDRANLKVWLEEDVQVTVVDSDESIWDLLLSGKRSTSSVLTQMCDRCAK